MELNKNERYNNLTLEDINDLCEELEYNCEDIKSLEDTTKALKFLNDKFKDTGKKFDITYQQKYWFLTKEEQEQVGKESYKHYFNTDSIPEDFIYDLMSLFDSIRIKKIRKDYPELAKKYEKEHNEDSENPCVCRFKR